MKDAEKVLVQLACLQLGIVPVDDPERAVKEALAQMPPEEAHKAKRKFRKVWRQALRRRQGNKSERNKRIDRHYVHRQLGGPPAANEIKNRRHMVLMWLVEQLEPMLKALPLSSM